jgi:hypothetical protein
MAKYVGLIVGARTVATLRVMKILFNKLKKISLKEIKLLSKRKSLKTVLVSVCSTARVAPARNQAV